MSRRPSKCCVSTRVPRTESSSTWRPQSSMATACCRSSCSTLQRRGGRVRRLGFGPFSPSAAASNSSAPAYVLDRDAACSSSAPKVALKQVFSNGPGRDRTYDLGIKSPLLYQLSYRPRREGTLPRGSGSTSRWGSRGRREGVSAGLVDLKRLPEWQESALGSSCDGPLAEGSLITERRRIMGREVQNELQVTAYDPPRRLTLKALGGPVPFTVDHQLVPDGDSTLVHLIAEAKPGTFMKLAEPMLARQAEQQLRADFERLKEQLEAEGYPSQAAPVD